MLAPFPRIPTLSTLALAVALTLPAAPSLAMPTTGNTPPVLSFGVGNSPIGGISRHADMPVGYRYQYFVGGLGADDWRHWNQPDGAFADLWLDETRQAGLTPVITYYEIVHAAPYRYEDPPLRNLKVSSTMKAYYENWIFLMQRIAAFGDPVVVHLEPDLFGYMQWTSPDPAQTEVSVASSGLAQAAGFENNARGFAQLMVALRDQYAPNVILGWHASAWATGTDLILNDGDPDELAFETAEFYRALNAGFDVTFTEFSDRDSGYYQINGSPGRWWDEGDFDTFRSYISRLSSELDQDVMLWQIPIGNTLYRSMNNTVGHYQDNRAEYFLKPVIDSGDSSRLAAYRDAGVVALMFGAGQDDQTNYYDARGDGVTNPAPIDNRANNHTDHLNDQIATLADDDGGFLRLGVQTYYNNGPLALEGRPPAACSDGLDNDGDGKTDYPADPGCSSAGDNSEVEPLPICSDGLDNDGDGLTDYPADPGCSAADDNDESNPPPLTLLSAQISITNDWGSGYCANGTVTNSGSGPVEWHSEFIVGGPVTSMWNGVYNQVGTQVDARGASWNNILQAGASTEFGFCTDRLEQAPPAALCADGIDNDGDGLTDYPADPGCSAADDNDETNAVSTAPLSTALVVDNDWGSGYCATVTVTNNSSGKLNWQVSLPIEGQVDSLWNAKYTQSGATLSVSGEKWNKSVAAGASVNFGFCAAR